MINRLHLHHRTVSFLCRMIPSTSKNFLINDLAAGREYDLCVLAVYDDGITSLTATRVVGCVQFHTASEVSQCRFMHSQFLGGTMIIIIGGIIVASVLVFIIILMIRYKAYSSPEDSKTKVSASMHSQTNGSQQRLQRSTSKQPSDDGQREAQVPKECMALVLRVDNEKREDPAATTAILEVELPPLNVDKMKRRTSLDAQRSGPPSEDTQTDQLTSTHSLQHNTLQHNSPQHTRLNTTHFNTSIVNTVRSGFVKSMHRSVLRF